MSLPIISSIFVIGVLLIAPLLLRVRNWIASGIRHFAQNAGVSLSATERLSAVTDEFAINANRQAALMQRALIVTEEIHQQGISNASNARESEQLSLKSHQVAETGKQVLLRLTDSIGEISVGNTQLQKQIEGGNEKLLEIVKLVSEIGQKTKIIDEIVFQTKLLSFNASVEAARAGVHGKGFAVVAEEVGKLARVSGEAARQISTLLEAGIQRVESIVKENRVQAKDLAQEGAARIESGLVTSRECSSVFDEILTNAANVQQRVAQISQACQDQANLVKKISDVVNEVEQISQSNHGVSKLVILSRNSVNQANDSLQASLRKFSSARLLGLRGGVSAESASGISSTEIVVGMSNATSGASSALGVGMGLGAGICFNAYNRSGGAPGGRKIRLIHLDDAYDPGRARENTKKLIDAERAFALFGYVGTATCSAALPLVRAADIPFFGAYTGAQTFRLPLDRNVFNIRASYLDEARGIVSYLVSKGKTRKVAMMIQDDAYGAAGESAMVLALTEQKLELAAKGVYQRGTSDVQLALHELEKCNPDAIVMVGSYKACAAFTHQYRDAQGKALLFNFSFVGTTAYLSEAGAHADGVCISQVLPSPWDSSIPIVQRYQENMQQAGHQNFDYTSLEGYVCAAVFIEALKSAGASLNRTKFRGALENLSLDLGGLTISFSADKHSGSDRVWLTELQRGRCVDLGQDKFAALRAA